MTTELHDSRSTATAQADDGIRCLWCEYNLTGLDSGACPECGKQFDRDKLIAYLAGAPAPIPIWGERADAGTPITFVRTLFAIWFHPVRFARRFPLNPNASGPIAFARITLVVAALLIVIPPVLFGTPTAPDLVLLIVMGVWGPLCINICERMATVTLLMSPEGGPTADEMHERSLGLVRMTRAYLLQSAALFSIACTGSLVLEGRWDAWRVARVGCPIALVYWWICMTCIATAYRRTVWNLIISLLLLPIVAAISIGLAWSILSFVASATGP